MLQTSTKVSLGTALIGVAVSAALAVATVLSVAAGGEHGGGLTPASTVFSLLFLILNPLQLLLVVVLESRLPGWLFWALCASMVPAWWGLVGMGIGFWFRPAKSAAIQHGGAGAQRTPYATLGRVALTIGAFFLVTPVLLVSATIALTPGKEDGPVSCEILKSGIVSNRLVRSEPNPQTTSGVLRFVDDFRVVEETLRVPVRKDIKFGFEYRFPNLPFGARVVQVISHPKMVKPDGSVSTGSRREKIPGPYFSYILNHDYELVPGEWRFEYWYGGIKLCEQSFQLDRE